MKPIIKKLLILTIKLVFVCFSISIFWVMLYKYVNPPITSLMIIRAINGISNEPNFRFKKNWKTLDKISPNLILAIIAAEDNKFPYHFGVDWEAIKKAYRTNKYSKIKRGASTITQQMVKNVFLVPSRTYLRKVLELYFTYLIEIFWSKNRIMEVYLNVIELGKGIYGVEAASKFYYKKSAKELTIDESAMLAAILPSPLKRNPIKPSNYLKKRQGQIISLMHKIGTVKL